VRRPCCPAFVAEDEPPWACPAESTPKLPEAAPTCHVGSALPARPGTSVWAQGCSAAPAPRGFRAILAELVREHERELAALRHGWEAEQIKLRLEVARIHKEHVYDRADESPVCAKVSEEGSPPTETGSPPPQRRSSLRSRRLSVASAFSAAGQTQRSNSGNLPMPPQIRAFLDNDRKRDSGTNPFAQVKGWSKDMDFDRTPSEDPCKAGRWRRVVLRRFVRSQTFDAVCASAIGLNAVLLGYFTHMQARNSAEGRDPDQLPGFFSVTAWIFTLWFSVELAMRFSAAGFRQFFCSREWSWNVFDLIVVTSDIVQTILEASFDGTDSGGSIMQNVTVQRLLRVLRLTRAIRLVRLVRFLRELRMMVVSILQSASSLVWSLMLLGVTIYIFGIYFVQIVAYSVYRVEQDLGDTHVEDVHLTILKDRFGSLWLAAFTLYQAVTGGLNWGHIGEALVALDWTHGLTLAFYIFFTTTALLNIITGIFVDSAIHSAQADKDEVIQEQMRSTSSALSEMQKLFEAADIDNSGTISVEEFEQHLQRSEVRAHLAAIGIEVGEARGLFKLLDLDKSGEVTIEEFVFGCMRLKGGAKSIDLANLMYENKRMAQQWHRFFTFCHSEFEHSRRFQARVEDSLSRLLGEPLYVL